MCQAQKRSSVAKDANVLTLIALKKRTPSKMLTAGIYKTTIMITVLTEKIYF